jgi:DNA helicase HerA-like ATPase
MVKKRAVEVEKDESVNAEVISVFPDKVRVAVNDLILFRTAQESLRVGSYLKVSDNDNVALICIIESFSIEMREVANGEPSRRYIIEAYPLGTLSNGAFRRGGDELAIPPKRVLPASNEEVESIYSGSFDDDKKFCFASLAKQRKIRVPIHGDKFFNKHIAVVGATGSGKSHTVASILQRATSEKTGEYAGLNNSHIVVFDLHSEYSSAFPNANVLGVEDLVLPYWLLNEDEMEELFLESGDRNNYNQQSLLRTVVTLCKQKTNPDVQKVHFDSPLRYSIRECMNCLENLSRETKDYHNPLHIWPLSGEKKTFSDEEEKLKWYCEGKQEFAQTKTSTINKGAYADGTIDKFVRRLASRIDNSRLQFIFGDGAAKASHEAVLQQLMGYQQGKNANITILDLSGIPFEVLSITVSLISRILFDYAYYFRRSSQKCDTPMLLVYEEAHKYAPRSDLARFKSSLSAIERIAKEGRKYGTSLLIASQRPSEISETVFSQCSNFLAMRLTNPDDQAYVRRLLPDTLGNVTAGISALEAGEALLIGDATVMPSVVYIDPCSPVPSSNDIPYFELWKGPWRVVKFDDVTKEWRE